MASWKEERDRLVAQTLAFVQQVAAAHPAAASRIGLGSTKASSDAEVASPLSDSDVIEAPKAVDEPFAGPSLPGINISVAPMPTNVAADLPKRPAQYATASERSVIAERVATFKARQITLNREREAYYDSVQARIRSSLQNNTGSGNL
jgi:hypothetical protein